MSAADIAATRHLLGLSQQELADELGVNRHTVKDWESGRLQSARSMPGVMLDLGRLVALHDADTEDFAAIAAVGNTVRLPSGPRPRGWYVAIGARLIASGVDHLALEWENGSTRGVTKPPSQKLDLASEASAPDDTNEDAHDVADFHAAMAADDGTRVSLDELRSHHDGD